MSEAIPDSVTDLLTRFEAAVEARSVERMAQLCVTDPSFVAYDQDGYAYRSRAHWALRPAIDRTLVGATRDVHVDGHAGWASYDNTDACRMTLVIVDESDDGAGWRVAHVHASPATPGPRPGGI